MQKLTVLILFALIIGLAACGGGGDSAGSDGGSSRSAPDAAAGEKLLKKKLIGTQAGCVTCHSLAAGVTIVGPSLATVGADAGRRVSGQPAEGYLLESINNPDAFVVDGFTAGVMPAALADELSDQQKADLVAYLMTRK